MDRRSWLWRRKSSEKSPGAGETDSSGSISSHSERFSDDQAYLTHNPQLSELTSKAVPADEVNDNVKTLTEKLSVALLNIRAKEDLVKQHAKVAEEAVSGWEKAEKEMLVIKQQLEATSKKNAGLEDRLGHLDAALKECVRQLRQAREEQEQRINVALARRTCEWETIKSDLETQLVELQAQLQTAKSEVAASVDSEYQQKLEAADKENSSLKTELLSRAEELEIRILERDLSAKAAETASKLHLESIKKVARLEAECHGLKSMVHRASDDNDHKSLTTSSIYVESFTDSQSESGERLLTVESDARKMSGLEMNQCEPSCSYSWASALVKDLDQFKSQKGMRRNLMVPSEEINLMDDFLEMERLAALPDTESGSFDFDAGPLSEQVNGSESPWKAELKSMIQRTTKLEEKLEKVEEEKVKSEMALTECQRQVDMFQSKLKEAAVNLVELQTLLALANESNQSTKEGVEGIEAKRKVTESQLRIAEAEIKTLLSKVGELDVKLEKERALTAQHVAKCQNLEDELSKMKRESELQHEAELKCVANINGELKIKQEKELAVAASKLAECQKTISSIGRHLKSLVALEDFLLYSEKSLDLSSEGIESHANGEGIWRLHSGDLYSGRDYESVKLIGNALSKSKNGHDSELSLSLNSGIVSEKSPNGFGKLSS